MEESRIREQLEALVAGTLSVEQALRGLAGLHVESLGHTRVDHHRALRQGFPEVIYCEGKTGAQVLAIFEKCAAQGGNILATRASRETYDAIQVIRAGQREFIDLAPANAFVRRQQHDLAREANLASLSRGKDPHRRVRISRVEG